MLLNQIRSYTPYFLLLSLCMNACKSSTQSTHSIKQQDTKIISLAPSHTEWIYALEAEDLLIARSDNCDTPPQVKLKPSIGSMFPINTEKIISYQATDLLMIDGHDSFKTYIQKLGINVHTLQSKSMKEYWEHVLYLGKLFNRQTNSEQWIKHAKKRLASLLLHPHQKKSVFIEIWQKPLMGVGQESYIGDAIRLAGAELVVKNMGAWPQVSLEQLIQWNPDVLLISSKDLYEKLTHKDQQQIPNAWRTLKAVQKGDVYLLNGRFTRNGPRLIDHIIWIHQQLYPSSLDPSMK